MPVAGSLLDDSMRQRLSVMYRAADRHYHSMTHIDDLLALAERHADLVADAPVMEAAIWFHDAILDTRRNDNEARSADLAREWLAGRADPERVERVALMIESTASHVVPGDLAADLRGQIMLFLDMDLSILGADAERFDAYEAAVRHEYDWVSEEAWRSGRSQVLRRFLERPSIFATLRFRETFEATARTNIARSLARLDE